MCTVLFYFIFGVDFVIFFIFALVLMIQLEWWVLISFSYWIRLVMKWHVRSYWIRTSSILFTFQCIPALDKLISHQTIHTLNAIDINSHFESLRVFDDKMMKQNATFIEFDWGDQRRRTPKWAYFSDIRCLNFIMHQADNRPYVFFIIFNIKFFRM